MAFRDVKPRSRGKSIEFVPAPSKEEVLRKEKLLKKRELMNRYRHLVKRAGWNLEAYGDLDEELKEDLRQELRKAKEQSSRLSEELPTIRRRSNYFGGGNIVISKEKRFF